MQGFVVEAGGRLGPAAKKFIDDPHNVEDFARDGVVELFQLCRAQLQW